MPTSAASAVDPLWLKNARQLVGLREIVGSRHEPKVLEFFKEAGHPEIHDDETAWCAAFANAMLRRAGYAGTGALNARAFLNWGTKLDTPQIGCIAVFKRGNSSWQGHVAFFVRDLNNGYVEVLGGNQGNAVSVARMPKSELLGYRWPLIKSATPKPKAPAKEAAKAGAAAAGGAFALGVGKTAVDAGWGFQEWAILLIVLAVLGAAGYAMWRWRKARQPVESFLPEIPPVSETATPAEQVILADNAADPPTELDPLDPLPAEAAKTAQDAPTATDGSSSTVSVTVRSAPAAAPAKRVGKKAAPRKRKPAPKRKTSARKRKAA